MFRRCLRNRLTSTRHTFCSTSDRIWTRASTCRTSVTRNRSPSKLMTSLRKISRNFASFNESIKLCLTRITWDRIISANEFGRKNDTTQLGGCGQSEEDRDRNFDKTATCCSAWICPVISFLIVSFRWVCAVLCMWLLCCQLDCLPACSLIGSCSRLSLCYCCYLAHTVVAAAVEICYHVHCTVFLASSCAPEIITCICQKLLLPSV